ncbi:hypothetical protein ACIBHX_51955 [Nonomuraea sp. NPDC050536]|uniref:hypothetical protein n=1 Tax=Nonomuraea sp. NPDC050536 TaxID=3364366 RepID=UPI0037C8675B
MSVLSVPVHVDALCLGSDRNVAGPSADFTRLPYVDPVTGRDIGADLPYLGEILSPAPFEAPSLRLKAGIHLHWALPDALTRMAQTEARTRVPLVPDRWLVTRAREGVIEGQWVVESDALSDDNLAGVAYPVVGDDTADRPGRPYRYLGRSVPIGRWVRSEAPQDRLRELTAIGYGDPAFAAYYPSCHSVFGFYDPDYTGDPPPGLSYDVMGWYDDPAQDELARTLATEAEPWRKAMSERLSWAAPPDTARPGRMVCFGRIVFEPGPATRNPGLATDAGVCIGNTPTEALAAHLGAILPDVTPDDLESLLEALTFADELENKPVDLSIGLTTARHTATFSPIPAPPLWNVRRLDESTDPGTSVSGRPKPSRARLLPLAELDGLLSELNAAQAAYDRARSTVTGLRRRLFADWYKYMLCAYRPDTDRDAYPDIDEVAFYLERSMARLDEIELGAGRYPPEGAGDTLAHRLARARDAVERVVRKANAAAADLPALVLSQVPAPRYYRPNDPVVLLTGSAATPSDRHGQDGAGTPDGLLACQVIDEPEGDLGGAGPVTSLRERIAGVVAALPEPNPATRVWNRAPWHPVLMQWEVEFFPVNAGNNLHGHHRDYASDFFTRNYVLSADGTDPRLRPGSGIPDKAANVYSGITILSPATRPVLSARILRYLAGGLLIRYNAARTAAGLPAVPPQDFMSHPDAVLDWYRDKEDDLRLSTLVAVYRHLASHEADNLAQSLGGFNDALLMLRLARQLPVAEPLGFPAAQEFTARVASRVGGENRHAPQPLSDFNPIRAGALRLRRLRVVDNFGTTSDVDVTRLQTTARLRVEGHPGWVAMPPRLAQAARITLRLLDADHDTQSLTGLPGCSPVCGLLVPDNLDDSLRVFARQGTWLGSLYALPDPARPDHALWRPAPGGPVTSDASIGDPHLRAVIGRLRDSGADGVGRLLPSLDEALQAVEPADYAQHRGRAVLMGRPIAVVRAEVGLELMEPPAVHQDWNVFRQDMRRADRETNGFPLVRFPVKIGEHGRLEDGVLGFWLEEPGGALGPDLHLVHDLAEGDPRGEVPAAIDLPPRYLTLLVDPRGAIHATSGILPTESVRISAEHYQDAVERLEVGFFAGPVLTDGGGVAVPLPAEPGSFWTWRERDRTGWQEVSRPPTVRRDAELAEFGDETWTALITAGWLTALDDRTALITPADRRPPLPERLAPLRQRLVTLLDRPGIGVPQPTGPFPDDLTVREGHLVLRPLPPSLSEQGNA